jgi:hypothetical protein
MTKLAQTSIRFDPPTPTVKPMGFDPILSYIEGYTYNESGTVISNATVTVKLKADDQVFYKTTADESGFFAIYSNSLPFFEYYLEITNPAVGTPVKQTTSEFIALNQDYLASENLDLIKSTRAGEPIINPETGRENIILSTPTPAAASQPSAKVGNQMIALVFVLLFLIVAVGAILFYIVKKRQQISS